MEALRMTYKGHVAGGVIVLDEPVSLKDGTLVTIEVAARIDSEVGGTAVSNYDEFRHLIGALNDMPEDWSENHDKYLRDDHNR
jgi:hypothetical protein